MNTLAATLTSWLAGLAPDAGGMAESGRVRARTLVLIRWVAVIGQTAALVIVAVSLGYGLPVLPAFLAVAASVTVNLHAHFARPGGAWLSERATVLYLAYDLLQLSVLLGLTGGLANPFAILILAPVTVSASLLSRATTAALAALAVAAASAIALVHRPLPWPGAGLHLPALYVLGIWIALVLAVLFIAVYVHALAREARRRSDALTATQMALAREQRLSELGGLAAAAAHELGTPLGTIAVVARELATDLPEDSPHKEDAELLVQESARCRDILNRLARRPASDTGGPYNWLGLHGLVEAAAPAAHRSEVAFALTTDPAASGLEPTLPRSPEILHALSTLIHNAQRFAAARVEAVVGWNAEEAWVTIRDDGPGFAPDILSRLGEPYISGGSAGISSESAGDGDADPHMGLGIFIARTLLARTGGEVRFANRRPGAEVHVRWPRARLETDSAALSETHAI